MRSRLLPTVLCALLPLTVLTGCGGSDSKESPKTLVVATHDSWAMSKEVLAKFKAETGITVKVQPQGDAGELTNKLVLTKDSPLADGVYGIDNTFASRAVAEGVLTPYDAQGLPSSAEQYRLTGEAADSLTPIDYGDVCVNVDDAWFAKKKLHAAEDDRGPDRAGVQGPVRHARRHHLVARARLPAGDDRRRGRRAGRTTGRS